MIGDDSPSTVQLAHREEGMKLMGTHQSDLGIVGRETEIMLQCVCVCVCVYSCIEMSETLYLAHCFNND